MTIHLDITEFREKLTAEKQKATYSALVNKYGVNRYYLWNIINDECYKPPFKVALKLGIKTYAPAPVCAWCGEVHVSSRCPHRRRPYRTISEMPTSVLLWKLENREAMG